MASTGAGSGVSAFGTTTVAQEGRKAFARLVLAKEKSPIYIVYLVYFDVLVSFLFCPERDNALFTIATRSMKKSL